MSFGGVNGYLESTPASCASAECNLTLSRAALYWAARSVKGAKGAAAQ